MKVISIVLPFITCFCGLMGMIGYQSSTNFMVFEIGVVLQLLITLTKAGENNRIFTPVYGFNKKISVYKDFLVSIENKHFESDYLQSLQAEIVSHQSASKGITLLNKLTHSISLRYNFVASMLMNGLLMWNEHCKDALSMWNKQYGKEIRKWIEVIGEIETLISLAVIGRVKSEYCFPIILESEEPTIMFQDLCHPMIRDKKAIGNDLSMKGITCVITGSNMSGKTTFLRSIGVNLALAYAGAPVVAKHFETSYMEVFTSMRIEDRVDEGISTFYAELLRIKEMIVYSDKKVAMMVLIDEIFKGTNSADRILGATQTIKRLGKPWLNVMVTTHDFELCRLAEDKERETVNYHFEESYKKEKICFDYKLKKGPCQTTNAQYLLKMVGILD